MQRRLLIFPLEGQPCGKAPVGRVASRPRSRGWSKHRLDKRWSGLVEAGAAPDVPPEPLWTFEHLSSPSSLKSAIQYAQK